MQYKLLHDMVTLMVQPHLNDSSQALKEAAVTDKPCARVEEEVGGLDQVPTMSSLPRNKQQVASLRRNLFQSHSDPKMALVDLHKMNILILLGLCRYSQVLLAF